MSKNQNTSPAAASKAGKVLNNPKSTKPEKTAAASALSQKPNQGQQTNKEVTSPKAASKAGEVLGNPKTSQAAKTAAASALTQAKGKKK